MHELVFPERIRSEQLQIFEEWVRKPQIELRRYETQCLHRDGTEVPVEISTVLIDFQEMRLPIFFLRDLTSEKYRDQVLQDAQSRRMHFSRQNAIGAMATALAHEMAQPLGAARNYLSVALMNGDRPASAILTSCLEALDNAADKLTSIRGIFRKSQPHFANLPLRSLVDNALGLMSDALSGIQVVVDIDDAQSVWADRMDVEQIIINLVRNASEALKANDKGNILIGASECDSEILVYVEDDGPGILQERRRGIFEAFGSSHEDGMGMGLAISRVLVDRCQGRIWLDENASQGCRFCFTLPRKRRRDPGSADGEEA